MSLKRIIILIGLSLISIKSNAVDVKTYIPVNAKPLLPQLNLVINERWDDFSHPEYFGGQIEQESCVSLTNKRCWDSHAELKTSREYGFGLGQITIAYTATGKVRFNNFDEAKRLTGFKDWQWADRFNAFKQMHTIIAMDKTHYTWANFASDNDNRIAFMFVAYNSGRGGIMQDRALCRSVNGCNPDIWWNNVANHSTKSKVAQRGYGKSFYAISREYPVNVMRLRGPKYIPYLNPETVKNAGLKDTPDTSDNLGIVTPPVKNGPTNQQMPVPSIREINVPNEPAPVIIPPSVKPNETLNELIRKWIN